jgi:phosphatidylinositol kinase/protein kinase (PI-3  family)
MKSTWKIINIETGRSIKRDDTQYIIDKARGPHIAETINEYFLSLADDLANLAESGLGGSSDGTPYMEQAIKSKFTKIRNKPVMTKEIEKIIHSLKKVSCGFDLISLRVLKLSSPYISSPLNYICNKIMQSGIFPERLKYSTVKPLFKKGEKQYLITDQYPC